MNSSVQEDRVLWESVKKGNELAFSSLFKKFINPLYNYGMHFFSDSDLVKDCIQELFTSIWLKKESLSDVVQVKFYLFKSFRNLFFAKISSSKHAIKKDFWDEDFGEMEDSKESEWIQEEESVEISKLVQHAIQGLTRRQREAVILRFYNNLDYKQISEVMGISVEAAHNLNSKAIQLLRIVLHK
ncbi:RNA polymerase sigma factor [Algoriphagus sp. A40]|uniref:RNA polymerase sigma factor n=1 Tax=Algoriphagus sp. A40 TaxID=1945863 RepID=UPI001439166D|nr:sigma-70 family RNA polymerase sigma factor [Algoriphagus sp. A40]